MALEQKSKPNIDKLGLKPVEISYAGNRPDIADQKLSAAKNTPTVYYCGVQLPAQSIVKLIIDSNKFMPMVYMCFNDVYNLLQGPGFPADNAKFTVILPSNSDYLGQVFVEFKVQKYELETKRNSNQKKVHFWGILNVEPLLISKYKEFKDTTSYDLIKNVASDAGLGFQSNINSTNDKQTWLNFGWNTHIFLQDTINKAWNGESSFLWGFVDLYYNMNYIDVESSLSQNIDDIKWYITTMTSTNPGDNRRLDKNKLIPGQLSNDIAIRNTNTYFTSENALNQSTDISIKRGYIRNIFFYDKDGNWSKKAGKYKIYGLDTITTAGTNSQSLILKGDPGSTKFYTENNKNYYIGKIDTKNMYSDFLWAKMQNSENIADLQKVSMQIRLPIPNFNIKRYEKFKLIFTSNTTGPNGQAQSNKLTGEWLVTGLSYEWNGNSLSQVVNIVKRELGV